jgi:hypothetical protein
MDSASAAARSADLVVARKCPLFTEFLDLGARHVLDVRLPELRRSHTPLADVEANHLEAGTCELHGQRQTHIPQANDSYRGAAVGDAGKNFLFHLGVG